MTRNSSYALIVFAVVLTVMFVLMHRLSGGPGIVALPERIETMKAGISIATEIKNSLVPEAQLTSVDVNFDCSSNVLTVRQLEYGFVVLPAKTRAIVVVLDNATRKAFCGLDTREIPAATKAEPKALVPFDSSRVALEIPDVMKIAETNGLAEFRAVAPPNTQQVELTLAVSNSGPVWSLHGDSWDNQGPVSDVVVIVDASSGAVLNRSLQSPIERRHR